MDRSHAIEPLPDDIEYPTSDGMPMAETPWHRDQMNLLIESLRQLLAGRHDAHIGGNEIFYWQRGNAQKWLSPDVWVAFDLAEAVPPLGSYKLWVQGKGPDLVVEVSSRSTRHNDFADKKEKYRRQFEVAEYVIFDVEIDEEGDVFEVRGLHAWRLDALGRYQPVALDGEGAFVSQVLGGARLRYDAESRFLRVVDGTGNVMPGSTAEGLEQGRAQGLAQGQAQAVLGVLAARHVALDAAARRRIEACTDPVTLQRWLTRAATATTLEDVFEP